MNSKDQKVIELVKIQSWYIPRNAESYQMMRTVGVPLLKIHSDLVPTLKIALDQKGIRAKATPFSSILEAKLDTIGAAWLKDTRRRCKINTSDMTFLGANTPKNRKMVASMDNHLAQFFARWGYQYSPEYSEQGERLKFRVDFKFSPTKDPLVPSVVEDDVSELNLILGFTRIHLIFNNKTSKPKGNGFKMLYNELRIYTKAGTEWVQIHAGTFTNEMIGELNEALAAFSILHTRRKVLEV